MKLNKPSFWNKKYSFFSIILLPLTLFVLLFIFFKKRFIKKIKFNIPIICVGKIYIGGTGKTPASIYIGNELSTIGKKPVIVRKFYKSHKDEHNLIKENFKNLVLDKSRVEGIIKSQNMGFDTVILDDGFQDYKIKKDLNIVCFNQQQLIGNGLVLPSGPLRESLKSLRKAHIILINGQKDINFEKKVLAINNKLEILYTEYKPLNINEFKNKKLMAFAGIGNPNNFFHLLEKNNLNVQKKLIYPDHYNFTQNEILKLLEKAKKNECQIITTEKDFYKVKDFKHDNIRFLKIAFELNDKKKLLKILSKLYYENN